jgi:phosphatidylethanolamine/phosphatidyl-N-methylethanolamine N-methyltransferase
MTDDIYLNGHYQTIMGTGLISVVWRTIHGIMERPYRNKKFNRILELGAGSGEHLNAVKSTYKTYYLTDLRLKPLEKFKSRPHLQVKKIDISKIDFPDNFFERTIVTCVLAHVENPVKAISEIRRVTKSDGYLTIYLPCEPGVLLRIVRTLTTIRKNKKYGVQDPYFSHFQEHRNYYLALNHFIEQQFETHSIKSTYYPFPFLSWNLNLFKIYQIQINSFRD